MGKSHDIKKEAKKKPAKTLKRYVQNDKDGIAAPAFGEARNDNLIFILRRICMVGLRPGRRVVRLS